MMAGDNKIKYGVDVVVALSNATKNFKSSSYRTIRDALKDDIPVHKYHEEIVSCYTVISGWVSSLDIDKLVNLIFKYGSKMLAVYMNGSVIRNGDPWSRIIYDTSEKGVIYRYNGDAYGKRCGGLEHNENIFFNRMPVPAVISPYLPFLTNNSNKPDVIVSSSVEKSITPVKIIKPGDCVLPVDIQRELQKSMLDAIRNSEHISGGRIPYYTITSRGNGKSLYLAALQEHLLKEGEKHMFKDFSINTDGPMFDKSVVMVDVLRKTTSLDAESAGVSLSVQQLTMSVARNQSQLC